MSTPAIHLYNSLTKEKELFTPTNPQAVLLYTCGPTVYNHIHTGNIRSFLMADLLRRVLTHAGYTVKHVKNITDIGHLAGDADEGEDKVIAQARKEGKSPEQIAEFYTASFQNDERTLGILETENPRASQYVKEMITLIEKLIENGYAYESQGSVYFDVATFPDYGQLSGNTLATLRQMVRGKLKKEKFAEKHNPEDFVLWVKADPSHFMKWESPWSLGYPGWHIECSAMSKSTLGEQIDIHTGGPDNKFPHHENEIAQSEGASGKKPFVKYWVHGGQLSVDGKKMAKSAGNFYTVADIEKMGFSPTELRLALLSAHYRSPLDFSQKSLLQARENLARLKNALSLATPTLGAQAVQEEASPLAAKSAEFLQALYDDLNTPEALAVVLTAAKWARSNSITLSDADRHNLYQLLHNFMATFGIPLTTAVMSPAEQAVLEQQINQREEARQKKDFATADQIRAALVAQGIEIMDTAQGPVWYKN